MNSIRIPLQIKDESVLNNIKIDKGMIKKLFNKVHLCLLCGLGGLWGTVGKGI